MKLVTQEMVNNIILNSEIVCQTRLGKITVVTVVLPNGFTITETSASASIENYDYQYGIKVCMKKIEEKIWELETYKMMAQEYDRKIDELSQTEAPISSESVPEVVPEIVEEGEILND